MRSPVNIAATLLGLCIVAPAARAQQPGLALRANPFSRPAYTVDLGRAESPVRQEIPVELELRATMVSGDTALANINGEILSAGQEYEGYRVLRIREGSAVLSKGGERLVLNVYEKQLGSEQDSE